MEILIFFGFWVGIFVIGWVWGTISEYIDNKQREIRDKVYHELLNDEEITKEIESYKGKLDYIGYSSKEVRDLIQQRTYYKAKYPKYYEYALKCPDCETGHLMVRKGPYGTFFGCTNYPTCKKKMTTKLAREEIKSQTTEAFSEDFVRAYS